MLQDGRSAESRSVRVARMAISARGGHHVAEAHVRADVSEGSATRASPRKTRCLLHQALRLVDIKMRGPRKSVKANQKLHDHVLSPGKGSAKPGDAVQRPSGSPHLR